MLDLTHPQTQHSPRLTIIRAMRVETKTIPNATLGAFCEENHVALMHTSRGVLDGLTFATKDVFHIAGSQKKRLLQLSKAYLMLERICSDVL